MSNGNTSFENALENMQRGEEKMGELHTDMHSEVKRIRVAISKTLNECKVNAKPYDIRKDNQRWDIHFDYQIEAKVKKTLTTKISQATGIEEKNINIISRHS